MIEKAYGFSLRGKAHIDMRMPNQDSYVVDNQKNYTLAIVCDGLGSKKHSKVASKRLCKIIKKEVEKRFKEKTLKPLELIQSVKNKFNKKIWPFNLSNCDTTCLFALISSNSILMFQVGDGLNVLKIDDDIIKLDIEEKDFINETISFGKSKQSNWKFKIIKKEEGKKYSLLICTDGLSEDIIEDSLSIFIETISNNLNGKFKNNNCLKNIIKKWPNKYSRDDKTMVVIK